MPLPDILPQYKGGISHSGCEGFATLSYQRTNAVPTMINRINNTTINAKSSTRLTGLWTKDILNPPFVTYSEDLPRTYNLCKCGLACIGVQLAKHVFVRKLIS